MGQRENNTKANVKFIRDKKLSKVIGDFWLNREGEVYLWATKKQTWIKWKTTTFDNGDICFKYTPRNHYKGKWINVKNSCHKIWGECFA